MASLTGQQIQNSYLGLLKTTDNAALTGSLKQLTDGAGNNLTLQASTAGMSFNGNIDFTAATVTGLPVDPNTTYDLAAAQDGANVDLTLTGSDATVDTIQLNAGTNITLTETGGNITIDAAGGGTDTTYDLASAQDGSNVDITLTGSDATVDTIQLTAGTNITLTDNGSNNITIDAAGGGGGGSKLGIGADVYQYNNQDNNYIQFIYPSTQPITSTSSSATFFSFGTSNAMKIMPTTKLEAGMVIDEICFNVKTANANFPNFEVALYDSIIDTNGDLKPGNRLTQFTTNATLLATTGTKHLTGINYTVPADTSGKGVYFCSFWATANTTGQGQVDFAGAGTAGADSIAIWPGQTFLFANHRPASQAGYSGATPPPATGGFDLDIDGTEIFPFFGWRYQ